MRPMTALWLALLFQPMCAQVLVLAGCETDQQLRLAEQLIEHTRREGWREPQWRAECRRYGFTVVGSTNVFYLIPLHYTPTFAEDVLIPLFERITRGTSPVFRLDELPEAMRYPLLNMLSRPAIVRYYANEPSVASFQEKMRQGEIVIGIADWWKFQEVDPHDEEPLMLFGRTARLEASLRQVAAVLSEPSTTQRDSTDDAPIVGHRRVSRWHFVFSHEIPVDQQTAHLEAYLDWLKTLQRSLAAQAPAISEQIWKILHPEQSYPNANVSYSIEEIQSSFDGAVRLEIPTEDSKRYAQKRYRFTGWEVGIDLIKRTPNGKGVQHHFLRLDVLLGLHPY